MNTLMITSLTQGFRFDAEAAVAPFAVVEKLAQFVGRLLKTVTATEAGAPRLARA
jgi:hypothetical protein